MPGTIKAADTVYFLEERDLHGNFGAEGVLHLSYGYSNLKDAETAITKVVGKEGLRDRYRIISYGKMDGGVTE